MKRIFIALICFFTFAASAQMTLKRLDGTPINDGDVLTFDVAEEPGSYLGIKVYNASDEQMNVKVKCISFTNTDGTNVQLCLGDVCLGTIIAGNSYPPNFPAIIDPTSENGNFDHFLNLNPGIDTSIPVEYVFKFYQLNNSGIEIGNSVTFSYRYASALGVSNFNQLEQSGVILKSNIVTNEIEMIASKNVHYTLFDVNGKSLASQNITIGNHSLDVTNLNSGVYILSIENSNGQKSATRIIKK